jgi:hypothetical protein
VVDLLAGRVVALAVRAHLRAARADLEGLSPRRRAAAWGGRLGRLAGHRDVGANPVQRFQHVGLGLLHAGRGGGDGDDEAYAQREAQRDKDGLPHPAAQLPPQVGDEEHDLRSRSRSGSPVRPSGAACWARSTWPGVAPRLHPRPLGGCGVTAVQPAVGQRGTCWAPLRRCPVQ